MVVGCCSPPLWCESIVSARERLAWRCFSALLFALGINKLLELQTTLTAAGRILAHYQGWFEQRRFVQLVFIALVALTCVSVIAALATLIRQAPSPTWLALMGMSLVFGYVMIRAGTFHHIDRFTGTGLLQLPWWILEISGIFMVLLASVWRQLRPPPSDDGPAPRRGCRRQSELNLARVLLLQRLF
jgi:hypothetical protein